MENFTPIVFVGGKGGVGKTTISSSIALTLAKLGKKTLVVSTDPAHSLGDALNKKLSAKIQKINNNLDALELNALQITNEHFKNIEDTLRGYAKPEMFGKIKEHLELSKDSPGAQEAAILEAICNIISCENKYDHIIFDTAPTGHTMRLMSLPSIMSAWTDGLMARQKDKEKLKQAAEVFWEKKKQSPFNPFKPTTQNRWDRAYEKLNARKELFSKTNQILKNPLTCKVFLVMIPQVLPFEETKRALKQLQSFKINCGGVFINQIIPNEQKDSFWQKQVLKQDEILQKIQYEFIEVNKYFVPLSSHDLRGEKELDNFLDGIIF